MEKQQAIEILMSILLNNKYAKTYMSICSRADARAKTRKEAKKILGHVEGHHVLPKSFENNSYIVYLTVREHYICHALLLKCLTGQHLLQMKQAFKIFSYDKYRNKLSSRQSEYARTKTAYTPCSQRRRDAISRARLKTPKVHCEFCNKDFSPGNYKKYHGEQCTEHPNNNKQMIKTQRSRNAKIRCLTMIEKGVFNYVKRIEKKSLICPHCSKQGTNYGAMMRHHFSNCPKITGQPAKRLPIIKYCCLLCRKECFIHELSLHVCKS